MFLSFYRFIYHLFNFIVSDNLETETLDKLMENKAVKEKKIEFERKLEILKKKLEKVINR